jgi:hypothetical protein
MERKCLSHLDRVENWEYLHYPRPGEDEILPWKPFFPIFRYNLLLFTIVFALLFLLILFGSGVSERERSEDLLPGVAIVLALSIAFAFYVAHLYRKTWNRRARTHRVPN